MFYSSFFSAKYEKEIAPILTQPLGVTVVIVVATIVFGAAIEVAQHLMEMGRGCESADFIADAIGAAVGGVVSRFGMAEMMKRLFC